MTKIDKAIIEVFKKSPNQMIRVKFVFDCSSEVYSNNITIAENQLKNFSSLVHSRRKTGNLAVIDATVQAFLCETLANDCISLVNITY